MKKLLLLGLSLLSLSQGLMAFDRDGFALHLRKTLSLDSRVEIKVSSDPVPSGIGNMLVVNAVLGGAPYPVYISPDEKKYIWGFVSELAVDPDKKNEKLMNLTNVRAKGSPKAPVTVVDYSDYQCGHCKTAHDAIDKELYKAFTKDQVRFVYKHFPLNMHEWAEPAAVAAECAAMQRPEAFWDMGNYFFNNQAKINKDNMKGKIEEGAKGLSLNMPAFNSCMSGGVALAKVQADKKEGVALGVNATPAIYINGRARRGFQSFDDVKVVIEEKLKEIKK